MFNWLGFALVVAAGAWAAFYSIKRARGRKWGHWLGYAYALVAGVLAISTVFGDMLRWTADWLPFVALALIVVFGLITVFDLSDKRPDAGAMIGALILPSLLVVGIGQVKQFSDEVKDNGKTIRTQVESGGKR